MNTKNTNNTSEYKQCKCPILKKESLAKNSYSFWVLSKEICELARPGQFAHIKADGFSLRRPISICEIDKEKNALRFVFEVRGDGTEAIAQKNVGDNLDILAPLGHPFTMLKSDKKVICIGGGIGTPPMLQVAKHYKENATAIIGFRSANAVILNEDFIKNDVNTILCTDDGTMGQKGYVSSALEICLKHNKPDMIYACGPNLMLKAICTLAKEYDVDCEVSLEERMGCGVGACLVCACKTVKNGEEYFAHVCKDGPVFNSKEVML